MLRAATIEAFLTQPVGSYVGGSGYLVWCATPTICGSCHWGALGEETWRDLQRLFDVATSAAMVPPIAIWMDCRAVQRVDGVVFEELGPYLRPRLPAWQSRIARQVVLLPEGAVGFSLAGVLPALGGELPIAFFQDEEEALAALDLAGSTVDWERIRQLVAGAQAQPGDLLQLRHHLGAHLCDANLSDAAAALGVSTRALQRALKALDTSFSAELQRARVTAAARLLAETDLKLEVVARRVGCSSSSHLARLFRQATGETPSRHRERHQAVRR